jgi:hypothetical protein
MKARKYLVTIPAQTPDERPPDHPTPAGDEYPRRFFHVT